MARLRSDALLPVLNLIGEADTLARGSCTLVALVGDCSAGDAIGAGDEACGCWNSRRGSFSVTMPVSFNALMFAR